MKYQNVSINGNGTVFSGEYDKIVICGRGTGSGQIKANKLEVSGTFTFKGKIECPNIVINGSIQTSSITSGKMKVTGKIKCMEICSDTISIRSSNHCSVNVIKCNSFECRKSKGIFKLYKNNSMVHVKKITCKQADVKNLHSDQVMCDLLNASGSTMIQKLICKKCNADESVAIHDITYGA